MFCARMKAYCLQNVEFLNNPAKFLDPYYFRVTFDCIAELPEGACILLRAVVMLVLTPTTPLAFLHIPDLEWRLIYVASPGDEGLDQELDDCLVGPVPIGVNSFEFSGSAPQPSNIPPEDLLGVAALILTGSYKDQEFVRVGYYQNTEYDTEEMRDNPPTPIQFDRLKRDINFKPRVTRFQIKWCVRFFSGRESLLSPSWREEDVIAHHRVTRRDVSPQNANGQGVSAGAAMSAAVPSANDLDMEDTPMNGVDS